MGARRGEFEELVRQRVAALLSAHVQHHDRNAAALGGVEQVTSTGELVLDGDAGVTEALEARADREEQRLDIVELVDFGAWIGFELDSGTPHRDLDLESIQAL